MEGDVQQMKAKKRTFKFAKNVKFYGYNGYSETYQKCKKADGIATIKSYGGLGVAFKVKNNKIVKVIFLS